VYSYIARQPILNTKQETVAFELLFRDGECNRFPDVHPDKATSKIIVDNQLTLGIEEITGELPGYINFHVDALMHNIPTFLDPKKVVIEILEDVSISDNLLEVCKFLKGKGYTLALDDHDFDEKWDVFLPYIDIVKVDILDADIVELDCFLDKLKRHNVQLLAQKVETLTDFEQLKLVGFTLFQGYFFARPEMVKKKNILTAKQHLLDLMSHVSANEFDFDAISNIFNSDLGLTYKLLRFINNPGYGPSKEISSLKHALIYIGEVELKKFIALLALADLKGNKSDEIIRASLVKAKFCEKIAQINQVSENPPKAFLTGMLSHIDGVLDQNISEVMNILPIHSEIKEALIHKENYLAKYLTLAGILEQGKWQEAKAIAKTIGVEEIEYLEAYQESISWSDAMLVIQ